MRLIIDDAPQDFSLECFLKRIGYIDKAHDSTIPLKIFKVFLDEKSHTPEEITEKISVSKPTVYRHIKKLTDTGLLKTYRKKYKVYYQLNGNLSQAWEMALLKIIHTLDYYSYVLERMKVGAENE